MIHPRMPEPENPCERNALTSINGCLGEATPSHDAPAYSLRSNDCRAAEAFSGPLWGSHYNTTSRCRLSSANAKLLAAAVHSTTEAAGRALHYADVALSQEHIQRRILHAEVVHASASVRMARSSLQYLTNLLQVEERALVVLRGDIELTRHHIERVRAEQFEAQQVACHLHGELENVAPACSVKLHELQSHPPEPSALKKTKPYSAEPGEAIFRATYPAKEASADDSSRAAELLTNKSLLENRSQSARTAPTLTSTNGGPATRPRHSRRLSDDINARFDRDSVHHPAFRTNLLNDKNTKGGPALHQTAFLTPRAPHRSGRPGSTGFSPAVEQEVRSNAAFMRRGEVRYARSPLIQTAAEQYGALRKFQARHPASK